MSQHRPLERRRDAVTREEFNNLVEKVEESVQLAKNANALLMSFKVMAHIGKWVTVISAMLAAVAAAYQSLRGG